MLTYLLLKLTLVARTAQSSSSVSRCCRVYL